MYRLSGIIKYVLFTEKEIKKNVKQLAKRIIQRCREEKRKKIALIMILNGAYVFASDLGREISKIIHSDEALVVTGIVIQRYGNETVGSQNIYINQEMLSKIQKEYKDFTKIIIDDIADEGETFNLIYNAIGDRNNTINCALLLKPEKLKTDVPIDLVGFEIPDEYVIGYGMGLGDFGRGLPYIAAIDKSKLQSNK